MPQQEWGRASPRMPHLECTSSLGMEYASLGMGMCLTGNAHPHRQCTWFIQYEFTILRPVVFKELKSVQSALSDLLTTSATHGTFSRPSTKRGLILIGLELTTNARVSFEHC